MAAIHLNYGTDFTQMTYELMQSAEISKQINPDMRIVIKPNLVVSRPASGGATTHPEIVEGIIRYLHSCNAKNIVIAEGSWVGDSTLKAWNNCGYSELAKKYSVTLFDTKTDNVLHVNKNSMRLALCESITNADYLINVPVLKGHCQTAMTCCLKNLKGCIPDSEKRRFHAIGLHEPIATLATAIKPNLHIIDNICGDLSFEEGGNPVETNRIILGFDPVLLDSYGARLMGYHPDEIKHLRIAKELGVGEYWSEQTQTLELNAELRPKVQKLQGRAAKQFEKYINEDSACSACYAGLVFALDKLGPIYSDRKINIGQGFRGKNLDGIGIGTCASGCTKNLTGCPPQSIDIVKFLSGLL